MQSECNWCLFLLVRRLFVCFFAQCVCVCVSSDLHIEPAAGWTLAHTHPRPFADWSTRNLNGGTTPPHLHKAPSPDLHTKATPLALVSPLFCLLPFRSTPISIYINIYIQVPAAAAAARHQQQQQQQRLSSRLLHRGPLINYSLSPMISETAAVRDKT